MSFFNLCFDQSCLSINKFQRKFGYVYDGENRTPPSNVTEAAAILDWKDKDKAKLFLSRAVSDEFLDDFEAVFSEDQRSGIKFSELVKEMQARYTPSSNKVHNHYLFHRLSQKQNEKFDDFCHGGKGRQIFVTLSV